MKRNVSSESLLSVVSDISEFQGVDPSQVSLNLSNLRREDNKGSVESLMSLQSETSASNASGEPHHHRHRHIHQAGTGVMGPLVHWSIHLGTGYGFTRPEFYEPPPPPPPSLEITISSLSLPLTTNASPRIDDVYRYTPQAKVPSQVERMHERASGLNPTIMPPPPLPTPTSTLTHCFKLNAVVRSRSSG